MLPHNGQGASQSIEDGYALACCIAAYLENQPNTLGKFMKAYEDCRLPHTTAVQKSSRNGADIYSQFGELETILDENERYGRMAEKLGLQMNWIWEYDVDAEIRRSLNDLGVRVAF